MAYIFDLGIAKVMDLESIALIVATWCEKVKKRGLSHRERNV